MKGVKGDYIDRVCRCQMREKRERDKKGRIIIEREILCHTHIQILIATEMLTREKKQNKYWR